MLVYAGSSNWHQEDRIDIRLHDTNDSMSIFPTRCGVSLHLQEWVHLKSCKGDIEHDIQRCKVEPLYIGAASIGRSNFVKIYRSENNRIYVDIRYYRGCDIERIPTRYGVRLTLSQWKKLIDIDFESELPQLMYLRPCCYGRDHSNQEYKCAYCASNTQAVINARIYNFL